MKCKKCGSKRIIEIYGKTDDCFDMRYKGKDYDGYVPDNIGLGDDSDAIVIDYCADCGAIQGDFPIEENLLNEIFDEMDEDDDMLPKSKVGKLLKREEEDDDYFRNRLEFEVLDALKR